MAPRLPEFSISLRRTLVVSLLVFALVPAAGVTWLLARGSQQSVGDLAEELVKSVAIRVQAETENHLQQAHVIMNGLFPADLDRPQTLRARRWLDQPALFEPMAFALTRQSPGVPFIYMATARGNFFGVDQTAGGAVVITREVRDGQDNRRSFFLASQPGDRSRRLPVEDAAYEPRTRPWYEAALRAGGRVFSPIYISPQHKQLVITLSQPVYDDFSGAAGVFAADLHLQRLADFLRTQLISSRGAAYLVDEQGLLVATSAGDPLYRSDAGVLKRVRPNDSRNPVIRASYAALEEGLRKKSSDTVIAEGFVDRSVSLHRLPMGSDDALIAVRRPFGDGLGLRWTLVVAAPESDFTAVTHRALLASLAVIAAVMMLGSLVAVYVAQRLGRRLESLGRAAQSLGRGEIPPVERDTHLREVRQLSQVLHDSAERLESYRTEVEAKTEAIEEANQQLEARVASRTAELEASREDALQAAKAKAAFLATMSHEIRTPLNGVVGMSTLLAETRLDEEQVDYLQTIRLSSDQLLAVINDILDFSKIESGKLDLESEPLSPRSAMEEACDIAATRAREKNLELIIDVPEGPGSEVPPAVAGDVTRIRQVLINLINNAIKFTEQGEVTVSARRLHSHDEAAAGVTLEFRVSDTGIGIPPERVGALFQAFTQVDASTTRKYGGTGLGLAICKRLVELMGGQIGVQSTLGEGSSFWFTVRVPLADLPPMLGAVDATALHGRQVLVVDDHETNVRVLTRQLEMWGMRVHSAESGGAALRWLAQHNAAGLPDIIITDMHMPEMDGVTLAQTIKANPAWSDLPLVLLTSGFMPPGHEAAGLFAARLLKPTRQKQLFDTVARCISTRGGLRSLPSEPLVTVAGVGSRKSVVLVVDDNAVNLKVACAMLTRLGYEAQTAIDGQEAVEAVAKARDSGLSFGAVLMDVNMPRLNGLQATVEIHALLGAHSPPVIALTAAASPEDRARCMDAGMNDYLTKPLHVAALAETLERWVSSDAPTVLLSAPTPERAPTEANQLPEPVLVDFDRLAQFREFDDEQLTMTREVISLFMADAEQKLLAIQRAVEARDAQALSWASHALVGAAGNVGAVAMQAVGSALEAQAKAGRVPEDAELEMERLRLYWLKTRDLLAGWL